MNSASEPTTWKQKVWTFLRIMNVRLRFILLMVITGVVASQWENITAHWERWTRPKTIASEEKASATEYFCPMHPSVIREEPGNCPICGMPLSKRERGEEKALPDGVIGRAQLSPYRMQLAGIATTEIAYRSFQTEIRTVGTIDVDERKVAHIAARTAGRIERLLVDFTGERVEAGAPLVEIYSPDLVSTQQEYLIALGNYDRLGEDAQPRTVEDAKGLLHAARERLRRWGIGDDQIAALERDGRASVRTTIRAPIGGIVTEKEVVAGQYVMEGTELYTVADLSNVWMTAYVYEHAVEHLCIGQAVEITTSAHPGRIFKGQVSFVWPLVDRATRTLRVRGDIPNPDLALRPGMYVEARILGAGESPGLAAAAAAAGSYVCPMHPEVVSDVPGTCPKCYMRLEKVEAAPEGSALTVPESAVIDTGSRKIVYLEREAGVFDAVEVQLGNPAGGYYPVLGGLAPGDHVVTSGAFLVDAEIRLNPAAAGSYFGASGGPSRASAAESPDGHKH
jgi:Cu(I)/Ag(I) efflux system membrane fusion protein